MFIRKYGNFIQQLTRKTLEENEAKPKTRVFEEMVFEDERSIINSISNKIRNYFKFIALLVFKMSFHTICFGTFYIYYDL